MLKTKVIFLWANQIFNYKTKNCGYLATITCFSSLILSFLAASAAE